MQASFSTYCRFSDCAKPEHCLKIPGCGVESKHRLAPGSKIQKTWPRFVERANHSKTAIPKSYTSHQPKTKNFEHQP